MAQLYRVVPIKFERRRADRRHLRSSEPDDPRRTADVPGLRNRDGGRDRTRRLQTIARHYDSESESVEKLVAELADDDELKAAISALENEKFNITDAEALADSAPVRKLLNMVLLLAIKDHASDIHFEPFEDEFRIRIKAEGVLYEMVPPPRHLAFAITTRIKVMANLDIAERRMPQDGRIELMVGGHPVDLRVSVLPTIFGESVVMRILDRSVVNLSLGKRRHGRSR